MNCSAYIIKEGSITLCPEPATKRLTVYLTQHPQLAVQRLARCDNHTPKPADWPAQHYTLRSHAIAEQKELPI